MVSTPYAGHYFQNLRGKARSFDGNGLPYLGYERKIILCVLDVLTSEKQLKIHEKLGHFSNFRGCKIRQISESTITLSVRLSGPSQCPRLIIKSLNLQI